MPPPSATFRFVPIPPNVVIAPPVPFSGVRFDQPLEGGSVSAMLKVTWTAKTPICVAGSGSGGADDPVLPIRIGDRHCLTGSTLRGMIRAVLETATFSHLGRINEWRHHGFRDFQGLDPHHPIVAKTEAGRGEADKVIKAGWLRYERDVNDGTMKWFIYKAASSSHRFLLTPITSILARLGPARAPSFGDWQAKKSARQKYALLEAARIRTVAAGELRKHAELYGPGPSIPNPAIHDTGEGPFPQPIGAAEFHIVCNGPFAVGGGGDRPGEGGKPKKHETLFPGPGKERLEIPPTYMLLFHKLHSAPSRLGGNPKDLWRDWLVAKGWATAFKGYRQREGENEGYPANMVDAPGIPVFWKGDKDILDGKIDPGEQSFWFSLSRAMRVPFRYSVGQVAQATYMSDGAAGGDTRNPYTVPRMKARNKRDQDLGWDFARAIFGEIDGANVSGKVMPDSAATPEAALRGRVAFAFAFAAGGARPGPGKPGVFAQPRESFWPFYLRDRTDWSKSRSYNSDRAIPAGRKRTRVRHERDLIPFPTGNDCAETTTHLRFLPSGTVFEGCIRVHNLHPAEFGALLWALTFGDLEGGHWHQAGRAKGYGYGALAPKVEFAGPPTVVGVKVPDPARLQSWIDCFLDYMDPKLKEKKQPGFEEHPSIAALTQLADPAAPGELSGMQDWGLEGYASYIINVRKRHNRAKVEGREPEDYLLQEPDEWRER